VWVDAGTYVAPQQLTVATYLVDHWFPAMEARGLRASTLARYETHVRCAIAPALGRLRLQALTPTHLNKLYRDLRAAGRAPKTIRNVHGVLSKALADAERWGLVGRNSARLADVPPVTRPKLQVWAPEQTRAFLTAVSSDRLFAAWLLAATTGMRRGELLGLRWADVDLDAGVVRVTQARVRAGNQVVAGEPKTARGRRTIALDPATVAALRQHRKRQTEARLLAGPHDVDSDLVFTMPDGTPIHPNRFSLWFRTRARGQPAGHPAARSAPLLRHRRTRRRRTAESDERAPGPRHGRVHPRYVHDRAAGDGQVRGRCHRRAHPRHRRRQGLESPQLTDGRFHHALWRATKCVRQPRHHRHGRAGPVRHAGRAPAGTALAPRCSASSRAGWAPARVGSLRGRGARNLHATVGLSADPVSSESDAPP
jgi:integrase